MSESANPFAPPQAEVHDVAVDGPVLGRRTQRLFAALVDTAIYLALFFGLNALLRLNLLAGDSALQVAVNGLIGAAMFLAVQGYTLVTRGQTLGKIALGLRIVRSDGSRVGAARILGLRYGVGFLVAIVPVLGNIYGLLDALLIFRESRKCLHDNIADTIVVQA